MKGDTISLDYCSYKAPLDQLRGSGAFGGLLPQVCKQDALCRHNRRAMETRGHGGGGT